MRSKRLYLLRYLQLGLQSKQFSPDESERKATESIVFMMEPYWNAASKPYSEMTAMIIDLVKKLQSDEWSSKVTSLGLTDAVSNLKTLNDEFITVYSRRVDEKLLRQSAETLRKIRPQVDNAFRDLADAINAIYFVAESIEKDSGKTEEIGAVIDALNAQILQFTETLSRRGVGTKLTLEPSDPSIDESGSEKPEEGDGGGSHGERPGAL